MAETSPPPGGSDGWEEKMVELSLLDPSPFQVRKQLRDMDSLRESMRTHGLLHPILARPMNGRLQVIAGHRRWKAAESLGWTSILARVKEMSDEEALLWSLIDNEHHSDTNPIEKATGFKLLHDPPFGHTLEIIGKQFGQPPSTVSEMLKFLDEPKEIQAWIADGRLNYRHMRALRRIADRNERVALARRGVGREWSGPEMDRAVKRCLAGPAEEKPSPIASDAPATEGPLSNEAANDAATKVVESLVNTVTGLSPETKAAPRGEHATMSGSPALEKVLRKGQQFAQKIVGRLPARTPLLRLALGLAICAIITGYVADSVENRWLNVVLMSLLGFLWLLVAVLVVRYFSLNKARFASKIAAWLQLVAAVSSRDIDAARSAAQKFGGDSSKPDQGPDSPHGPPPSKSNRAA